tara:strand:+ start:996 stop:1709 length:714 start_codon:yes stop_codon:yes gene_type:complete
MVSEENSSADISQKMALTGLILASIAPTISVVTGFVFQVGIIAIFVFILTKIWMFGFPAFWHLKIEKREISSSKPMQGGWQISLLLGIIMALCIYGAYFLLGEFMLEPDDLKSILEPVGLTKASTLMIGILFWVFINSVLEEYLFRWFITSKLEEIFGGVWVPVIISALIFTIHHTIALANFISPLGNFLCSLGLFIGGIVFSWLYMKYRSIWIPWLAHAICDIAVFSIAWHMIIGY